MGTAARLTYDDAVLARFGERLRELRERAGLSLSEAGEAAGLQRQHWSAYETGKRPNPTLAVMGAMARALDVELAELLAGVDELPGD